MTLAKKKTPTWLLERVAQGELDAAEVEQVRSRLEAEGRLLEAELRALQESDREILAQIPKDRMLPAIRRRAEAEGRAARASRRTMLLVPLALLGSAAAVLLLARPGIWGGKGASTGDDDDTTFKGETRPSPRLLVYRQRPSAASGLNGSELLSDGMRAGRGDLLQLAYDKSPDGLYGVLLSVDGARRVTQHLPEEGATQSPPLTQAREVRLPSAYELDDAPLFERFFLVTATKPFAINVVLDAAHALAGRGAQARTLPLSIGPGFSQTSVLVDKTGEGNP